MSSVRGVRFERDYLIVDLADGRALAAPLSRYPRLHGATAEQRATWQTAGAGQGIHWPEIDEDVSLEALKEYGSADSPNYRIVDHGETLALHEVWYDADGAPLGISSQPVAFTDTEAGGLIEDLAFALECAKTLPVLSAAAVLAGIERINGAPSQLDGGLARAPMIARPQR
jgi:hypothetical protein